MAYHYQVLECVCECTWYFIEHSFRASTSHNVYVNVSLYYLLLSIYGLPLSSSRNVYVNVTWYYIEQSLPW
jgi:hypothetical protein